MKKIYNIQKILNVNFKNESLLKRAITHKSYNSKSNYEKLEFLGDRVLGLVISKKLLEIYPDEKEGILDKKFASLVNRNKCYEVGKNLNLKNFILVANNKKSSDLIQKKIISDCIEAIIGAIYLDQGLNVVEKFILKEWDKLILLSKNTEIDAKTKLQELSLKKYKLLPDYKLISNTGPRHSPSFIVAVKLKGSKFVHGEGSSKKNAEQNAAEKFLNSYTKNELAR